MFRVIRDFGKVREAKRALIAALNHSTSQGAGRGVDIPNHLGNCECGCRVFAAAAQQLIKKHPHKYVLTKGYKDNLHFAYRKFVDAAISKEYREVLHTSGFVADPDDDVVGAE